MSRSSLARLARSSDGHWRAAGHAGGRSGSSPQIYASYTALGLREQYRYEPGPPGHDWTHVHPDIQICFSHDAAGRYRSGQSQVEVPPGAVSVIDAWEPHAAEDPVPQRNPSHYDVLYVSKARWDEAADAAGVRRRFGAVVTTSRRAVRNFRRLLEHLDRGEAALAIDADFLGLVEAIGTSVKRGASPHAKRPRTSTNANLDRARDLIQARLRTGVTLEEVAAEARLDSTYVVDAFRARFGVPPHRLQTHLRLELAKRRMIDGATIAEAAAGFADQSHLTRQLRRYMGITPGRYRTT